MGSVHVMLMENTLQHKRKECLMYTFDLKGSKHGRLTSGKITPSTVQKDLNFMKQKGLVKFRSCELSLRRSIGRDV